ncbi:MAG TPA: hypothetical protein VJ729_04480 [Nitrososphaeraceae archaeon]|nr:hypothetical protein [Nitrososphaeraceae archaeon]
MATCNLLSAFLHVVDAKETNGQLTAQQAAILRQQALSIQHSIGCSSTGNSGTGGAADTVDNIDNGNSGNPQGGKSGADVGNVLPLPH